MLRFYTTQYLEVRRTRQKNKTDHLVALIDVRIDEFAWTLPLIYEPHTLNKIICVDGVVDKDGCINQHFESLISFDPNGFGELRRQESVNVGSSWSVQVVCMYSLLERTLHRMHSGGE